MSFLDSNFSTLPKPCQSSIRRYGRCTCGSCTGVDILKPSSSSTNRGGKGTSRGSKNWRSELSSNDSGGSSARKVGHAASVLDATESHMLTILSCIDKLKLENDLEETSCQISSQSTNSPVKGQKRKIQRSSDADDEMENDAEDVGVLQEAKCTAQAIAARKRLVPSSPLQRQRGWTEKMSEKDNGTSCWRKWRQKMKEKEERRRKCRKMV